MKHIRKELVLLVALTVFAGFGITPSWAAISTICADCTGETTPTAPVVPLLSQVSFSTECYGYGGVLDMQLVGSTLYTGSVYCDPVFDVSDPRHPAKLYEIDHNLGGGGSGGHWGIKIVGKRYYGVGTHLAAWGLPTFNLLGGRVQPGQFNSDLDVVENKAYVAIRGSQQGGGFAIFDVTDPTNIIYLNGAGGNYTTILVESPYAYLGGDQFAIYNISSLPPAFVGSLPVGPVASGREDIEKVGNRIFLANDMLGILAINVQTPSAPSLVKTIGSPTLTLGGIIAFEVVGNKLFVATAADKKFKVIDIKDIRNPKVLAVADIGSTTDGLEVEVDPIRRIALVGAYGVINVFDVSNYLPCKKP